MLVAGSRKRWPFSIRISRARAACRGRGRRRRKRVEEPACYNTEYGSEKERGREQQPGRGRLAKNNIRRHAARDSYAKQCIFPARAPRALGDRDGQGLRHLPYRRSRSVLATGEWNGRTGSSVRGRFRGGDQGAAPHSAGSDEYARRRLLRARQRTSLGTERGAP